MFSADSHMALTLLRIAARPGLAEPSRVAVLRLLARPGTSSTRPSSVNYGNDLAINAQAANSLGIRVS